MATTPHRPAPTAEPTSGPIVLGADRRGRTAWPRRRTLMAWAIPFVGFLVIAAIWAIDHIEDDLEDRVQEGVLAEYGVELSDDQVDFDGRDGTIENIALPAGVSGQDVADFLEQTFDRGADREGDISDMTVIGVEGESATGSHDIEVDFDGETMTLAGDVLAEREAERLREAAIEAVGLDHMVDELSVLDADPVTDGAEQRIGGLADAIATMTPDRVASATAHLTDDRFQLDAVATSADAKADLESAAAAAGVDLVGTVTVEPAGSADAEPESDVPAGVLDMRFRTDGSTIVLDGDVASEEQRTALVDAAVDAVGTGWVLDRLVVTGDADSGDDADAAVDARVDTAARLIASLDGFASGEGSIDADSIRFSGEAVDDAARARLEQAVATGGAEVDDLTITVAAPPVTTSPATTPPPPTPEAEAAGLQAEFDALADEVRENVVFAPNDDQIDATAAATLDKVAAAMERYPQPVVLVAGHTDNDGDPARNLALSERRAAAVVAYLVERGVAAERIRGEGFGETEPLVANDTDENKRRNRRVELTALVEFDA